MRPFFFHFHNDARDVQTFELHPFDSLRDALAHGRALLDRNARFRRIIVVDGDVEVAQLTRGAYE
jgi:hypothetical protein